VEREPEADAQQASPGTPKIRDVSERLEGARRFGLEEVLAFLSRRRFGAGEQQAETAKYAQPCRETGGRGG
jgi:hypothetical protein